MRLFFVTLTLVIWYLVVCQALAGIRCGNDLISVGETSFEVQIKLKTCGSVIDKELVASSTKRTKKGDEKVEEESLIERWYIRVSERGGTYCYPLTFEQGILIEIGNWRECN